MTKSRILSLFSTLLAVIVIVATVIYSVIVVVNVFHKPTYEINLTESEKQDAILTVFYNESDWYLDKYKTEQDYPEVAEVYVGDQDSSGRFVGLVLYTENGIDYNTEIYKLEGVENGIPYYTLNFRDTIGGAHQETKASDPDYVDGSIAFADKWNTEADVNDNELMSTEHPTGLGVFERYIRWFMNCCAWAMDSFTGLQPNIFSIVIAFLLAVLKLGLVVLTPTLLRVWMINMMNSNNIITAFVGSIGNIVFSIVGAVVTFGLFFVSAAAGSHIAATHGGKKVIYSWNRDASSFQSWNANSVHVVDGDTMYTFEGSSVKQPWEASNITKIGK